jgi:trk system potassium uptake protein TrkH
VSAVARAAGRLITAAIKTMPTSSRRSAGNSDVKSSRLSRFLRRRGANQLLILGFFALVLLGTFALRLPISSRGAEALGWEEAFFTSTSAVTVTGLGVVNTALEISLFGQLVILALMQIGGIGFVAFSVLAFSLIGRRVSLQERFLVQQTLGRPELSGAVPLTLYVLGMTVGVELIGAFLLFLRWQTTLPAGEAAYYALFHAVSAFCNAGFDLFSGTQHTAYFGFADDPYTLAVSSALILIGGFGVTVVHDLWHTLRHRRKPGLHTRLTLIMTLLLTAVGSLVIAFDPSLPQAMGGQAGILDRALAGGFTAVSARTAGLTILPLAMLEPATQFVILVWMFIGGAPASMAGGIGVSTVAVIFVVVLATARGDDRAVVYGRTIPYETLTKAVSVMTVSTLLVVSITLFLISRHSGEIFAVAFEVVSAFSNTGYSLGLTAELDAFGRFLIAMTMFWGRLGPLTVVVALAQRAQPSLVQYPEEPIILG